MLLVFMFSLVCGALCVPMFWTIALMWMLVLENRKVRRDSQAQYGVRVCQQSWPAAELRLGLEDPTYGPRRGSPDSGLDEREQPGASSFAVLATGAQQRCRRSTS